MYVVLRAEGAVLRRHLVDERVDGEHDEHEDEAHE